MYAPGAWSSTKQHFNKDPLAFHLGLRKKNKNWQPRGLACHWKTVSSRVFRTVFYEWTLLPRCFTALMRFGFPFTLLRPMLACHSLWTLGSKLEWKTGVSGYNDGGDVERYISKSLQKIFPEHWKVRTPGCLVYIGDDISYPVMWGWFHKPL